MVAWASRGGEDWGGGNSAGSSPTGVCSIFAVGGRLEGGGAVKSRPGEGIHIIFATIGRHCQHEFHRTAHLILCCPYSLPNHCSPPRHQPPSQNSRRSFPVELASHCLFWRKVCQNNTLRRAAPKRLSKFTSLKFGGYIYAASSCSASANTSFPKRSTISIIPGSALTT